MPDSAPDTETLLEHVGFLRGLARTLVFEEGQAEDVVQDALLVALREKPRHKSRLRAWLAGITRNLALKSLRSEGRRVRREQAVARTEELTGTSEVAARLELHRALVSEVLTLDEPYRSTVVHRYFDGLSVAEIAQLMKAPPKTVETRLRRGVERLRGQLDATWGDRRAWSLGLVALVPFTRALPVKAAAATAATGSVMALTGAVMSTKTAAVSTVLVVAAFFAGWSVKPAGDKDSGTTRADRGRRTVTYDEYAELKAQLDAAKDRNALMRRELDEKKAEAVAKEGWVAVEPPAADTRLDGPRFVYGDLGEALNTLDWEIIGNSMAKMPPVLAQLAEAIAAGKTLEDLATEIGEIQKLNGPLVGEALKMSKSGIKGTGLNGIFTHPSVMSNMVHAALKKAGMPLTEEQEKLIREIGSRYTEEDNRRLAGYPEGTLGMEKLVGEADLRDRFFAEVYESLSPEQLERIRPEGVRGLTNVDLFSTGVMYGPLTRPVPFKDRAGLEASLIGKVTRSLNLGEAANATVQDAVRRWADSFPEGFLDEPLPAGGPLAQHKADRVRLASRAQAQLMRDLVNRLDLTEAQIKGLGDQLSVMVPYVVGGQ